MPGPLYQLAYLSTATDDHSDEVLEDILTESRNLNIGERGIGGFLMYVEKTFLQIIEGKQSSVDALYEALLRDTRHNNLIRVLYSPISERRFASWSMAFVRYGDKQDIPSEGFSRYLQEYLDGKKGDLGVVEQADISAVEDIINTTLKSLLRL